MRGDVVKKSSKKFGFLDFISILAIILLILSNIGIDRDSFPIDDTVQEYR